jgi:C1A family cysteine protease
MTVALTLVFAAFAVNPEQLFREFEAAYSKNYTVEERAQRLATFTENLALIAEKNLADPSAKYGHLSPLADWSVKDFEARNTLQPAPKVLAASVHPALDTSNLPTSFDWREKGAVTPVKDQKACGSCWAFGTVACIEGANFLANGKLVSLSEQELVDCDTKDSGCGGGLPSQALTYLQSHGLGEEMETAYPYTGTDGKCQAKKPSEQVFVKSWEVVNGTDEDQLAAALMKLGPLAIGINASPLQFYTNGVANPSNCDPQGLDHAVTIVGFGVEGDQKYWSIKNSWNANWGEKGYFRIVRGVGKCGLNRNIVAVTKFGKPAEEIIV